MNTVQQAFGSNLANELIKTYEGSNLVSDSQQDLVGDKYLAEQIRMIQEQQKTTSILDKWGHLLYEGERDYKSSNANNGLASGGSKTSLNAQSIGGNGSVAGTTGGYMNTYSNGSIAHYNQLIEQHQQQQAQLQQQEQQQQEIIQQYHEQLQQEQQEQLQEQAQQQQQTQQQSQVQTQPLRSSQSNQQLATSNSNHRLLAAVASQNGISSYAQSQSGLQSRTLSEVRLQAQLRAQLEAQAQARAQAQLQAQFQAQAQVIPDLDLI